MLQPKKTLKRTTKKMSVKKTSYPVLPTKKAEMLKTSADQPRELMKRETPSKKGGLKGLISNALNKAKNKTTTTRGTFGVSVDGKESTVKGVKKTVLDRSGNVKKTVFRAKGVGSSPVSKIKDVTKYGMNSSTPSKRDIKGIASGKKQVLSNEVDGKNYMTIGGEMQKSKNGIVVKRVSKDKGIGMNNPIKVIKSKTKYN